jgi:hypothetical protein
MVLVGAGEECEVFTTKKKAFERAIAASRRRLKDNEEDHATQK